MVTAYQMTKTNIMTGIVEQDHPTENIHSQRMKSSSALNQLNLKMNSTAFSMWRVTTFMTHGSKLNYKQSNG
jgi:hypothetical protein